jgi:ubiquinone/menaquinone biosynthesis C-methylase UbiE
MHPSGRAMRWLTNTQEGQQLPTASHDLRTYRPRNFRYGVDFMVAPSTNPPEYEAKIAVSQGKWWFERYDDWQELYARLAWDRNERVQQLITDGQRYLDIGCGFGDMLFLLRNRFDTLQGIDPVPVMLKQAIANFAEYNVSADIEIQIGCAEKLPFNDDIFDTVTMLDVYEHIDLECRGQALTEVMRVLKPGGELILVTPSRHVLRFWNVFDNVISLPIRLIRGRPIRLWAFVTKSFTEQFCTKSELLREVRTANLKATHFSRVGFYPAPETTGSVGIWLRFCWPYRLLRRCTTTLFNFLNMATILRQKMLIHCVKPTKSK